MTMHGRPTVWPLVVCKKMTPGVQVYCYFLIVISTYYSNLQPTKREWRDRYFKLLEITFWRPSRLAVIISSVTLWRFFCRALLATSLLSAEEPLTCGFSTNGDPNTDTTELQQHVKTLRDSFIPASISGLVSGVPWIFCSFCQSVKNWVEHNPPTSTSEDSRKRCVTNKRNHTCQ